MIDQLFAKLFQGNQQPTNESGADPGEAQMGVPAPQQQQGGGGGDQVMQLLMKLFTGG